MGDATSEVQQYSCVWRVMDMTGHHGSGSVNNGYAAIELVT